MVVAVLLSLELGADRFGVAACSPVALVAHVRLDKPLDELDGLDTDSNAADEDGSLEAEAGAVMAAEIGGPLGMRQSEA